MGITMIQNKAGRATHMAMRFLSTCKRAVQEAPLRLVLLLNISRCLLGFISAGIIIAGVPVTSYADTITFTFTGTATSVNPLVASTFTPGDTLSGSLSFDSALVDSNANPNVGAYAPLSSLMFTVGSYSPSFVAGSGLVRVVNGSPGSDQLSFTGDVTGPLVNGFRPYQLQLALTDPTGLAFSSDALPTAFASGQFAVSSFTFTFSNRADPSDTTSPGTNFTGVQGTFSGSSGSPVPEPATLPLLAGGLAAVTPWIRGKRRSASKNRN